MTLRLGPGDKAYDHYQGSVFGSIDSYLQRARQLEPNVAAVYVSTDDPSVASLCLVLVCMRASTNARVVFLYRIHVRRWSRACPITKVES